MVWKLSIGIKEEIMFTDITGKKRLKAGLHTHTRRSDGRKTPEEAIAWYAEAGYDILALTDHWVYGEPQKYGSLKVISGCEYNIEYFNPKYEVNETFHIVGFGMERDPEIPKSITDEHDPQKNDINARARSIVAGIRSAGGIAVLAHPAWSLNTPDQIIAAGDFDALEIYNSVSECGMSDRPYSGLLVDMLATKGVDYPLLATDDTHYYDGDEFRGIVMVEADAVEELGFAGAIREHRFYATQGPEIHLDRISDTEIRLRCTPVTRIVFHSNLAWTSGRVIRGDGLTEAVYTIKKERYEKYVRAEVTDAQGLMAWSNIIWA